MKRGGREWRGWQGWWGVIRGNAHYRHSSLKRMKRMIDGDIRRGLRESEKFRRWETWRDGGEQVQRFLFCCFFFWDTLVQHRAFTMAQHLTLRICPSAWAKHSENFPAYIQSKLCLVLPLFLFWPLMVHQNRETESRKVFSNYLWDLESAFKNK